MENEKMNIYFSASTCGFYDPGIHGENIPEDAVEITKAEHVALIAGQAGGQRIVSGAGGKPKLVYPPEPTEDELADSARAQREALLRASDWVALRAIETSTPVPAQWVAYRQQLRDVPQQEVFPVQVDWPQPPDESVGAGDEGMAG
ncbi:hypothetical protein EYC51_03345 [Alcaligenes faecalis]|nr:hypothetical protein EYC51_03345 [Alcaligenes faecalis]